MSFIKKLTKYSYVSFLIAIILSTISFTTIYASQEKIPEKNIDKNTLEIIHQGTCSALKVENVNAEIAGEICVYNLPSIVKETLKSNLKEILPNLLQSQIATIISEKMLYDIGSKTVYLLYDKFTSSEKNENQKETSLVVVHPKAQESFIRSTARTCLQKIIPSTVSALTNYTSNALLDFLAIPPDISTTISLIAAHFSYYIAGELTNKILQKIIPDKTKI
ncbi:MAG: hypothetical protein HQK51_14360 [Oligoflexia bacterium]|nr:hypothetical protein [Oligoflexia bacterium]